MERIRYAVIPRFVVKKKGRVLDFANIEEQFTNWIKQYTQQLYVIRRNTTISAILEPGCFSRIFLKKKIEFVDFAAIEFQQSDRALDYHYHIAPICVVKAKRLPIKEKGKVSKIDIGFALFEQHREEFEQFINEYINQLASQGLDYSTSTIISVAVKPGCLGMLLGKKVEYIDFEAYEFLKTSKPSTYKCKIFPRFKSKSAQFSSDELGEDISNRVSAETEGGYELVGKIVFFGFLQTGCLGKGENVRIDTFLFRKL
jgi:hypothetical protein